MTRPKWLIAGLLCLALLWMAPGVLATGGGGDDDDDDDDGGHGGGGPKVDLMLTQADEPDPVTAGNTVLYTVSVKNNSSFAATNPTLGSAVSKGQITDISGTGWSCTIHSSARYAYCTTPTLAGGATAPDVEVLVLTPSSTSASTLAHGAGVWCSNCDVNEKNNYEIEKTTVSAAGNGSSSGYIPPEGGSITTCGSSGTTMLDHTCATVIFPAGPGGIASVQERPGYHVVQCTPIAHCVGDAVDFAVVPQGYTAGEPIRVVIRIDSSQTDPGTPKLIHVEKAGLPEEPLPICTMPTTLTPCIESQGAFEGDWRGTVQMFSQDPIFEVGDFNLGG